MNIIQWIDVQILRFFQFISDCVAALSDDKVDNFFIASMCWGTSIVFCVELEIIRCIIAEIKILKLIERGILYLFAYSILLGIIWAGRSSCSRHKFGFKNILESVADTSRFFTCTILLFALRNNILYLLDMGPCPEEFKDVPNAYKYLATMCNTIRVLTIVSLVYFASCTPKPPSKNKVKKWLDNLFASKEIHAS
jgi:hypothetical protein